MTRDRKKLRTAVGAMLAVLALATPSADALPQMGWIPNSFIVPPVLSTQGTAALYQVTRRVVPQVRVPGRFALGHGYYGLWESVPGYGWTPLMPECIPSGLLQTGAPAGPGCGVEGIAFDEGAGVAAAASLYISTYTIDPFKGEILPGGVWKSEARVGALRTGSAGLTWRQILPGIRGNALLVKPTGSQRTIVAGRIQRTGGDIGTDSNAYCAPGCSPSVYVSHDDGNSWSAKTFTGATCADQVGTTSRLVGNLAYDRNATNVIYAAANSGLWISRDDGNTWAWTFNSCGNAPGFALTSRSAPLGRIYIGQNTASLPTSGLYVANRDSGGAHPFTQLINAQTFAPIQLPGWVQTILIDANDPTERTLYVSTWRDPRFTGGGLGGVFKVVDLGNGTATVTDLSDSFFDFGPTRGPYPFLFDPQWRPSLFLAQHPLEPDLLTASSVYGGVWTRSNGSTLL